MSLTILQYITPSRLGGAEEYFLRLVGDLRERGHRVLVVTKRDTPLRHELEKRDVELYAWHTRGKIDPRTVFKLCRLIKRERVDLVHTHLTTASWNGNIAGRLCGVPVVAHVHAADSKTWFQWAHYLVAVAHGVKAHLLEQGVPAAKVPVLYYGIDLQQHNRVLDAAQAKARLGLPPNALTVGVIASLIERKGHRFLLQALHEIEPQVGPVDALFAGEGVLRESLEMQARGLGMEQRVHFLGFRRDVDKVMAACDIVALPSSKEGLSIAVMEAMALRRPVIATDVAGMPELVRNGETGMLIPPENVDALAQAMLHIYQDEKLAARLAQQGRALLEEKFDQRHCLAEVERFLCSVVEAWRAGKRVDCTKL